MALIPFEKPTPADAQNSSKVSQSQYSTPKHNTLKKQLDALKTAKAVVATGKKNAVLVSYTNRQW